ARRSERDGLNARTCSSLRWTKRRKWDAIWANRCRRITVRAATSSAARSTGCRSTSTLRPRTSTTGSAPRTDSSSLWRGSELRLQLDLAGAPRLGQPPFAGTMRAQDHAPALAGHGLDPVALVTGRSRRREPDVVRAIAVADDALRLAADARELRIGLQHRARLIVVEHEGPELLRGHVCGQVDF